MGGGGASRVSGGATGRSWRRWRRAGGVGGAAARPSWLGVTGRAPGGVATGSREAAAPEGQGRKP
jgi:hypothetical protein